MHEVVPLIEIDERNLGPAMRVLSPPRRAFVIAKVWKGLKNTEAARLAGYSTASKGALAVTGHTLAHTPHVIDAIREESIKLMDSQGSKSILTLEKIRDDENAENKDRIKCAIALLDRSGFHGKSETVKHIKYDNMTAEQMKDRILTLAQNAGLSEAEARKLLTGTIGINGAIDVEFKEVPSDPSPELTDEEKKKKVAKERENELRRIRRAMSPVELIAHKTQMRAEKSARGKAERQKFQQQQNGDVDAEPQPFADPLDEIKDIL